jgi:alpha-L-fucosidase
VKGGSFKEDFKYNAREIRFTTQGATLYATALGWPEDGRLVIRSLAKPAGESGNNLAEISLLGYSGKLEWNQTPEALIVAMPARKVSEFTATLKITGTGLKNIPFVVATPAIGPDAKGDYALSADDAELHGSQIKTENQGGKPNIGFWDKSDEWISWKVKFEKAGTYRVSANCATTHPSSEFVLEVSGQQLQGKLTSTGDWAKFVSVDLGQVAIAAPGEQEIKVHPRDARTWRPLNLREITFKPHP